MSRIPATVSLLLLQACADPLGAWPWDQNMDVWRDRDGDGYVGAARGGDDCQDRNPDLYPGAVSITVGTSLAYICSGDFTMGSLEHEVGSSGDESAHQVILGHSFEIGVYEVTQVQFESLMVYQPSRWPGRPDQPVDSVSWHEAAMYTNAVSYEADLAPCYDCDGYGSDAICVPRGSPWECEGFRLPTEAEWERAARGGASSAFSNGGSLIEGDTANCGGSVMLDNDSMLDDIAVYCGNDNARPEPVGSGLPNPWGLYDVHGNVWEWVHDWYGTYEGDSVDPLGPDQGEERVRRGGSFGSYPQSLRSAERASSLPGIGSDTVGFRVARTLD